MARRYSWWEARPERREARLGWVDTNGHAGETVHPLGRFHSPQSLADSYNAEARRFLAVWGPTASAAFYWPI